MLRHVAECILREALVAQATTAKVIDNHRRVAHHEVGPAHILGISKAVVFYLLKCYWECNSLQLCQRLHIGSLQFRHGGVAQRREVLDAGTVVEPSADVVNAHQVVLCSSGVRGKGGKRLVVIESTSRYVVGALP